MANTYTVADSLLYFTELNHKVFVLLLVNLTGLISQCSLLNSKASEKLYLTNLVFLVCTQNTRTSYFPLKFMACMLHNCHSYLNELIAWDSCEHKLLSNDNSATV